VSPFSTAFTPNRPLTPLSTAFTQRHRGVGAPVIESRVTCHAFTRPLFSYSYELLVSHARVASPLFSYSYELLFCQLLYFHNYLRCYSVFHILSSLRPRFLCGLPAAAGKSRIFILLRTLYLSCASFSDSRPLFSIVCALFDKKHEGYATRPALQDTTMGVRDDFAGHLDWVRGCGYWFAAVFAGHAWLLRMSTVILGLGCSQSCGVARPALLFTRRNFWEFSK
jgi:hypothetical protein